MARHLNLGKLIGSWTIPHTKTFFFEPMTNAHHAPAYLTFKVSDWLRYLSEASAHLYT